jgi:hypothetical protein
MRVARRLPADGRYIPSTLTRIRGGVTLLPRARVRVSTLSLTLSDGIVRCTVLALTGDLSGSSWCVGHRQRDLESLLRLTILSMEFSAAFLRRMIPRFLTPDACQSTCVWP